MKKLLVILFLFISFVSFGQSNTFYVLQRDTKLYFNPLQSNLTLGHSIKCHKNDTIEIISLKEDYVKVKYNNNVGYISFFYFSEKESANIRSFLISSENYIKAVSTFSKNQQEILSENSSDYLQKASNSLSAGFSLAALVGIYSTFSTKLIPIEINDKYIDENRTLRKSVGIVVGVLSVMTLIKGTVYLSKAGICLNKERKIFMLPSKSGIGVELKF